MKNNIELLEDEKVKNKHIQVINKEFSNLFKKSF